MTSFLFLIIGLIMVFMRKIGDQQNGFVAKINLPARFGDYQMARISQYV